MDYCRICGDKDEMTHEHIPPKSAFNDRCVHQILSDGIIKQGVPFNPKEFDRGKGITFDTTCYKCNHDAGEYYADSYKRLCQYTLDYGKTNNHYTKSFIYRVKPLNIIKQIVFMFMAIEDINFLNHNIELRKFVKDMNSVGLPDRYKFYMYYNSSMNFRYSKILTRLDQKRNVRVTFAEISYPPLGLIFILDTSLKINNLFDISIFSSFEYNEEIDYEFKLPVYNIQGGIEFNDNVIMLQSNTERKNNYLFGHILGESLY